MEWAVKYYKERVKSVGVNEKQMNALYTGHNLEIDTSRPLVVKNEAAWPGRGTKT